MTGVVSMQRIDRSEFRRIVAEIPEGNVIGQRFPRFLYEELKLPGNPLKRLFFWLLQLLPWAFVWIVLRPRLEKFSGLDQREVDRVYTRQAYRYDRAHHLTTHGQDAVWRRWTGWQIASRTHGAVRVLDLCTGTGLTVLEILKVTDEVGTGVDIVGLDYNQAMLNVAKKRLRGIPETDSHVRFCRGDATALVGETDGQFERFSLQSFDVVSQMFGIGGIGEPIKVFEGVLQVLCERGIYCLVDIHQPVARLPGEWPCLGAWLKWPGFEAYSYLTTTLPLVLARLWAWRDTTWDFYLAPLVTYESDGIKWGFEIKSRVVESERWWLGLPVMPTCKLVLEKVRLSDEQYQARRQLLSAILR